MIEVEIRKFLKQNMNCPAVLEQSSNMPKKFISIQKTGSSKHNQIYSSTFAFQSYGESMYEASSLNETLKEVVEKLVELDVVSDVRLNSDYNFTDTDTKRYRYQAVFDIYHY